MILISFQGSRRNQDFAIDAVMGLMIFFSKFDSLNSQINAIKIW